MDWFLYDNGLRLERVNMPISDNKQKCSATSLPNINHIGSSNQILRWEKGWGVMLDLLYESNMKNIRSSHSHVFIVKDVLKMSSKFTGGHPCRSVILIKLKSNFSEQLFLRTTLGGCFWNFTYPKLCQQQFLMVFKKY